MLPADPVRHPAPCSVVPAAFSRLISSLNYAVQKYRAMWFDYWFQQSDSPRNRKCATHRCSAGVVPRRHWVDLTDQWCPQLQPRSKVVALLCPWVVVMISLDCRLVAGIVAFFGQLEFGLDNGTWSVMAPQSVMTCHGVAVCFLRN